uniref:Transport and Golgi organization protein 6 homolog n=1 Tax=Phallusia mammillata TaxID=59560 RepID=A0A6F9DUV2_9ASCI|nr:transport and Golgi organization protein 6 homolog [Phallusia mammillata]
MESNSMGLHTIQQVMRQLHTLIAEKWEFQTVAENLSMVNNLLEQLKIPLNSTPCTQCGNNLFCQSSGFAHKCLLILQNAAKSYSDAEMETQQKFDLLVSVQDKKQLDYLLFFIVKVGISRHLYFQLTTLSLNFSDPPGPSTCGSKALYQICRSLLLSCNHKYIQLKLSNQYLLDILAGVLQLCYSPQCSKMLDDLERKSCLSLLTHILTRWAKLVESVKSLITLQGFQSSKSPVWLQRACGMLLSKCLLLPGGVVATINGVIMSLDTELSDSKKSQIISKILSTPPKAGIGVNDYCSKTCNQLVLYLQSIEITERLPDQQLFHHVILDTTFALYGKFPSLVVEHYFRIFFTSLYSLTTEHSNPSTASLGEESPLDINKSMEYIHFIFTYLRIENRETAIQKQLVPYIEVLFAIFMWTRNTVCRLQTICREVIVATLNSCPVDAAISIVFALCNISTHANQQLTIFEVSDDISFSLSSDGKLEVSKQEAEQTPESIVMEQDKIVQSIIEIVSSIPKKEFASDFFISMLKLLGDLQTESIDIISHTILTPEDRAVQHLIAGESQLILYALLMSVLESCDPTTLLSDNDQISNFVKVMLVRVTESKEEIIAVENLKLSFAILGLCLMSQENLMQATLADLVPLLQKVSEISWLSKEDKDTSTDLAIAIATHGKGGELDMNMFSSSLQAGVTNLTNLFGKTDDFTSMEVEGNNKQRPVQSSSFKPHEQEQVMDNLSKKLESVSVKQSAHQRSEHGIDNFESNEDFSVTEAIDSLFHKSPPVRAAAVRHLTNLFEKSDQSVAEYQNKLYQLFVERLKVEDDSFVYLSLLQGIFIIINRESFNSEDRVSLVLHLCDDYAKCLASKNEFDEASVVKIGEILVRFINQLGEVAPQYSKRLVPLFFAGARHTSVQVRASSLSNLADLCPLLRHVLSNFEQELNLCIVSIAKSDKAEPRRAAVFVIRRLIEVLGSDILQVLPNSLKSMYEVLKYVYNMDEDGAATLHAQLALERLDIVLKEEIFASPLNRSKTPTKKIVVLPP